MIISKILSTLPEEYKHFVTTWESAPLPERSLSNLISRLVSEENRIKGTKKDESVTFKAEEKHIKKENLLIKHQNVVL